MSFHRNRRALIVDPHPLNLHHHHHYRFNDNDNNNNDYDLSRLSRKQNRDLSFVDLDEGSASPSMKRRRLDLSSSLRRIEEVSSIGVEDSGFMSRDEIERWSPSRKDGIDAMLETHFRYSYCSYLQSLGTRLDLPQTTIGTAMVLCHRFFIRRSHACHDRFLIATAALFLASKSEETPCLLNTMLSASCEVCQKQNFTFPYLVYSYDWFEQYRERVIEAEQMILTTLDFELDVHHPYVPLSAVLSKLGLSQTVLMNLAWNLVNEGVFLQELRSSLWLQFKPHQIAAGAVFLAARFLNFDLSYYQNIWPEFKTTPAILQDVVQQLMELFLAI